VTEPKEGLNEALVDALREIGEPSTPEELRAKGVTRVRRVSREMVSKLIEKAVNRTLMGRTIGVPDRELRELVQSAHDEFNRIVGHQDEIDRTREQIGEQRTALKEELARIRAELAERRQFVEQRKHRDRGEVEQAENDELVAKVRESFAKLESFPPELRRLEREVIVRTLEALESARESALDAGRSESGVRVQELERRIVKLVQSLEATEQALKRVAKHQQSDAGLESIYRTVQGLELGDPDADAKRDLMRAIFEKNLELHRRPRAAAARPEPPAAR
jgi:DNA repair exonuclease SbcCD ATPase subunit